MFDVLARAREVIDIEIEGVAKVRDELGNDFVALVKRCDAAISRGGKLVITGIGKSGYIGQKMAATLSSVGSPSIFLHPVEALHGDLGVLQESDLLIALSYSGETDELLVMINPAKRLGIDVAAITASRTSRLGKLADLVVEMPVPREACPFKLAPTTTTTALLALGDALALVLLEKRGFTKEDYGRRHPGGAIGRAVTMRAGDIMRTAERFATATADTPVREALYRMGHARCGSAIIIDKDSKVIGIFTDGDFRRRAAQDDDVLKRVMSEVMIPSPITINENALAVQILHTIEKHHISDIIVVDDAGRVRGLVDAQDLPGLKLM